MAVSGRAEWEALPQSKRRDAGLQPEDAEDRTYGCRASSPEACGKHGMPACCAFVRTDGICLAPRRSWAKLYRKLLADAEPVPESADAEPLTESDNPDP